MTNVFFVLLGLAGLAAGSALAVRLRRWRPVNRPELGEYDPGPDAIDWLEAAGLAVTGLVLVVVAVIG